MRCELERSRSVKIFVLREEHCESRKDRLLQKDKRIMVIMNVLDGTEMTQDIEKIKKDQVKSGQVDYANISHCGTDLLVDFSSTELS